MDIKYILSAWVKQKHCINCWKITTIFHSHLFSAARMSLNKLTWNEFPTLWCLAQDLSFSWLFLPCVITTLVTSETGKHACLCIILSTVHFFLLDAVCLSYEPMDSCANLFLSCHSSKGWCQFYLFKEWCFQTALAKSNLSFYFQVWFEPCS